jgi:hypothetical protein
MKSINDYDFYSDYYFEQHEVGEIAKLFTNIIKDTGILLDNSYSISSIKHNYNINIIHMNDDIFKFTWDIKYHDSKYSIKFEQITNICKHFCIDGWEEEFYLYDMKLNDSVLSTQYQDIKYYTKKWVDYITFQHSRIILQFDFKKFKYSDLRKQKMKKIL